MKERNETNVSFTSQIQNSSSPASQAQPEHFPESKIFLVFCQVAAHLGYNRCGHAESKKRQQSMRRAENKESWVVVSFTHP